MTKYLGEEGIEELVTFVKREINHLREKKRNKLYDPFRCFAVLKSYPKVGDAVLYDKQEDRIISTDNISNYTASRYTPIGVIVIPADHNVYGTLESAMISLNYMNNNTPDEGVSDSESLYWGQYNVETGLIGGNVCVRTGTCGDPTEESTGVYDWCHLPSDNFESRGYLTYPGDNDSWYYYNGTSDVYSAGPSPYLTNKLRNPVYCLTESPSSELNCLADFDGFNHTQVLLDLATAQSDWKTAYHITNEYTAGYSPAACCCWRYHTDGTNQGDWYLPAMGELGYMISRAKIINETIKNIQSTYNVGATINMNNYYWSSTDYDEYSARCVYSEDGCVDIVSKDFDFYVRAFARVTPKAL